MRSAHLVRIAVWTLSGHALDVTRRLVAAWGIVLFVVVEAWTTIDWGEVARRVEALGPWRGLVAAVLCGISASALRGVELNPAWRRLLPRWTVGPASGLLAFYGALPALGAGFLFPGGPVMRVLGWTVAVVWLRRPIGVWVAVPALVLGEWLGAARVVVDLGLLLAIGYTRPPEVAAPGGAWRPGTRFGALVGRDLLCLWRTSPGQVWSALLVAPFPAVLVWGLRVNGHWDVPALGTAMGVLVCGVSPFAAAAIGVVRERLGERFVVRSWPVAPSLRLGALAAVFVALLLPTHAAMAAVGGVAPAVMPVPLLVMLASGVVFLATFRTVALGVYGAWALVAVGLSLARWEWAGLLLSAPVAWMAARRARWS